MIDEIWNIALLIFTLTGALCWASMIVLFVLVAFKRGGL